MLRLISLLGMSSGFLFISPPFRASVLLGLGRTILELDKYSPWSYMVLALVLGYFAVKSLAPVKPQ
jgi:hypothetical protein